LDYKGGNFRVECKNFGSARRLKSKKINQSTRNNFLFLCVKKKDGRLIDISIS